MSISCTVYYSQWRYEILIVYYWPNHYHKYMSRLEVKRSKLHEFKEFKSHHTRWWSIWAVGDRSCTEENIQMTTKKCVSPAWWQRTAQSEHSMDVKPEPESWVWTGVFTRNQASSIPTSCWLKGEHVGSKSLKSGSKIHWLLFSYSSTYNIKAYCCSV